MLILAKSVLGLMLGFVLSLVAAVILIPLLKKLHVGQSVSKLINERHLKKDVVMKKSTLKTLKYAL